jgi:hypothetical protein
LNIHQGNGPNELLYDVPEMGTLQNSPMGSGVIPNQGRKDVGENIIAIGKATSSKWLPAV